MIGRIAAFFVDRGAKAEGPAHRVDELQLAAAALLVEAACVDGHFQHIERDRVAQVAQLRFSLDRDEAAALVAAAETAVGEASQLLGFTRLIKDNFDYDERVRLVEMLWEVVLSDGSVDAFEGQLMRRICGLLYVTDKDSGHARQRARAALGRDR